MKTFSFTLSTAVVAILAQAALGTPVPAPPEALDTVETRDPWWSITAYKEPACTGWGTGWSSGLSHACGNFPLLVGATHDIFVKSSACTVSVWKADDSTCVAAPAVRTFAPGTSGCFSFEEGIGNFDVAC